MRLAQRAAACLAAALLALAWPARAEEVSIHLVVHGALSADVTASHAVDTAHFCSAAAEPWIAPDLPDSRPTPYPFYRLIFGQPEAGAELARPGPSIGLVLSNYFTAARVHSDAVNDSVELVIQGRHFVGHADMRDPGYRFAVTYREDQMGGSFVARDLHESGSGHATLDAEASWQCPPVVADTPEHVVSSHVLFRGAVPVRPDPASLRLSRSDIPCVDRGCAGWRVTDEATGLAFLARVDFGRLRLARRLRRQASDGLVDLLVSGEVRRGDPPVVVPRQLDGVEPSIPAPVQDLDPLSGPIPEAALP
jgi:hypothetical protein